MKRMLIGLLLCFVSVFAWGADKTITVKPSGQGGDYTTLALAIAGELVANADLVTMEGILYFKIEGDWSGGADITSATVSGFITSTSYYPHIYTDTANRAIKSSLDTNRYVLDVTDATCLTINNNNVHVDGLQIFQRYDVSATVYFGIGLTSGTGIEISNCRLDQTGTGADRYGIDANNSSVTVKVWNTIIEHYTWRGVRIADVGTFELYNCLLNDVNAAIVQTSGTVTVKNCAVFNNADDFSGTITIDYCASDDGDGSNPQDFTAEATDWNKVWEDYANGDYTLKDYTTSPCCIGKGTDSPGGALYSDDMEGNARSSPWDIGVDEYIVPTVTRSSIVIRLLASMWFTEALRFWVLSVLYSLLGYTIKRLYNRK